VRLMPIPHTGAIDYSHPHMDKLLAWYPLTSITSNAISDSGTDLSMYRNHGVPSSGVMVSPNQFHRIGRFGGFQDHALSDIVIGSNRGWRSLKALTMCAWMFTDDTTKSQTIFNKGFTSHADPFYQVYFQLGATGKPTWEGAINGNRNNFGATNQELTNNVVAHVAFVYDGQTAPRLYIDGEGPKALTQNVGADTSGPISNWNTNPKIGQLANVDTNEFDGGIADIRIWTRPLSLAEINEVMVDPWAPLISDWMPGRSVAAVAGGPAPSMMLTGVGV